MKEDQTLIDTQKLLSQAQNVFNSTARSEDPTATALIFFAIPCIPLSYSQTLPPSQKDLQEVMRTARKGMETIM